MSEEHYTKKDIESYLSDWDNLYDCGFFNNPIDIKKFVSHHKKYDSLSHFLSKGRDMIRSIINQKQIKTIDEIYQEYLLKIEVFDASGKSLGIEYAVGHKNKGKFEVSLPSVFEYPANYFEGSYKVISHSIINQ